MQNIAVIRLLQGRLAWYPPGAGDEPLWLDDEAVAERLRSGLAQRRLSPVFAAPGEDVRLSRLEVSDDERKHLTKSLPFMLEEQVAEDIEDLHFAAAPLERNDYAVAVCTRERMDAWSTLLEEFPGVNQWIPEPMLLPWQPGEWCLVLESGRAVVRSGPAEGFSVEREMLPLLLEGALASGTEPRDVIIYGADQGADSALVPDRLQDRVQWRHGRCPAALMLSDASETPLNLRQGDFAPRLPLGRWWRQWRAVAALFAVAFLLHLASTYVDYLSLKRENLAWRTAMEQS